MSRLPSVEPIGPQVPSSSGGGNDLRQVDLDQFLQLMIAELQNQDPLNPLDNAELLQQVSQIREIGATNQLTETLESIGTGQNLATASSMIGKHLYALSDEGDSVWGVVDRVSVQVDDTDERRTLRIHVGEHSIDLNNVREIIADSSDEE